MKFGLFIISLATALTENEGYKIGLGFLYSEVFLFLIIFFITVLYFDQIGIFNSLIHFFTIIQYTKWLYLTNPLSLPWISSYFSLIFKIFKPLTLLSSNSYNFIDNAIEETLLAISFYILLLIVIKIKRSKRSFFHIGSLIIIVTAKDFIIYSVWNIRFFVNSPISIMSPLNIASLVLSVVYVLFLLSFLLYFGIKLKKPSVFLFVYTEEFSNSKIYYLLRFINTIAFSIILVLLDKYQLTVYFVVSGLNIIMSNL